MPLTYVPGEVLLHCSVRVFDPKVFAGAFDGHRVLAKYTLLKSLPHPFNHPLYSYTVPMPDINPLGALSQHGLARWRSG